MTDKNKKTESIGAAYLSPQARVVFVKAQRLLCQSEPMYEDDCGNGGFVNA